MGIEDEFVTIILRDVNWLRTHRGSTPDDVIDMASENKCVTFELADGFICVSSLRGALHVHWIQGRGITHSVEPALRRLANDICVDTVRCEAYSPVRARWLKQQGFIALKNDNRNTMEYAL